MALEAINLMFQLSKPMTTLDQKLQIWGGACGLITASLELVGVVTATVKSASHNMIKFAANSFAIVGSAIFAWYDARAATEKWEKEKFLSMVYGLRSTAYAGLALGFTKISIDFLQNIGTAAKRPALIRFSGMLIRTQAYRILAFLGSVVWLARLNLVILGLTAIEIIYKAYFADNALEDWCKKSAFGNDEVNFVNEAKELEVFNQAFLEVVGL